MSQPRRLFLRSARFFSFLMAAITVLRAQPVDVSASLPDARFPYLEEVLQIALSQSPQMLEKNLELSRASATESMVQSQRWPSLGGYARYQAGNVSTTDSNSYTSSGFFYDVALSYSLFKWGDVKNSIEIERLQRLISEKNLSEAYRGLVRSLRVQFMQLVLRKKALATRIQMNRTLERQLEENETKHRNGVLSAGELGVSRMALDEARLLHDREQAEFEAMKRSFAQAAGLASLDEDKIPDSIPAPDYVEGQAQKLADHFRQSSGFESTPSVRVSDYVIRQSVLRYRMASTRLLPKLEARAGTRLENITYLGGSGLRQNATRSNNIELTANWSIFDGFYTRAAKKSALAEKRSAELRKQNQLKLMEEELKGLINQVVFSARALEFAERRLGWARGGYQYALEGAKTGATSEGQVEQARLAVLDFDQKAMAARAELFSRWSDLVGMLWLDPVLEKTPALTRHH